MPAAVPVAALLLVLAVVLVVLVLRLRARVTDLSGQLAELRRDRARAEEATDVRLGHLRDRQDRLEAELATAQEVASSAVDEQVGELWALALAAVRRTWKVSVCPSPGVPSPLDGAADELRAALEIEVDAAREEAGAAIELRWEGDGTAPPPVAVRALSIAQELIARLAKAAERATLHVESTDDTVTLEVEAVDAAGASVVPDDVAPLHRVGRGRYVLVRGGRPGR